MHPRSIREPVPYKDRYGPFKRPGFTKLLLRMERYTTSRTHPAMEKKKKGKKIDIIFNFTPLRVCSKIN